MMEAHSDETGRRVCRHCDRELVRSNDLWTVPDVEYGSVFCDANDSLDHEPKRRHDQDRSWDGLTDAEAAAEDATWD